MFEQLDQSDKRPAPSRKAGTWAAMNWIQRGGVIALLPFYVLSLVWDGRVGQTFAMIGWSAIFLGYVAGNLWRYRHALHFWYSVIFACSVHTFLLPVYVRLTELSKSASHNDGKGYMQLSFGVLIAEVLILLFLLKHVAIWIHRRTHPDWPAHKESL